MSPFSAQGLPENFTKTRLALGQVLGERSLLETCAALWDEFAASLAALRRGRQHEDADDDVFEDNEPGEGAASEEDEEGGAASIITDRSQATPLQQMWLATMSEGKNEHIAHRFAQ